MSAFGARAYTVLERTLAEAYIQGRVIGQWRWL